MRELITFTTRPQRGQMIIDMAKYQIQPRRGVMGFTAMTPLRGSSINLSNIYNHASPSAFSSVFRRPQTAVFLHLDKTRSQRLQ